MPANAAAPDPSDSAAAAAPIDDASLTLLHLSGRFDEGFYRGRAVLPAEDDAVAHYLTLGWRNGLEPNEHFEGAFLRPYYAAAGYDEAPALTWVELAAMGGPTPTSQAEAEALAAPLRHSSLFDAQTYARRLPAGMDPALHYVVVGERLGWRPSAGFDPSHYLDLYPDIATAGMAPLWHFELAGRTEGRRPRPAVDRLEFPPLPADGRPVILLISHDASRTGAPVLGWNVARRLAGRYRIVSLLLQGGSLEADFGAVAAVTVGPLILDEWRPVEMRRLAERLVEAYRPLYAIANSIESRMIIPPLVALGVPTVALIHEFAAYTRPLEKMRDAYDWAAHVVFPAHVVADSSFRAFSDLRGRRGVHILAQGRADPPARRLAEAAGAAGARPTLRPEGQEAAFLVLGAGFVQLRKGVDLFIAAAAAARRLRPATRFRFVWIGQGFDPVHDSSYSVYLAEQIAHSGLGDSFAMMEAVEDLDPLYAQADAFFMCSRLDPQPNVGIDAVTRGIPTVCFEGACGTAEILAADPTTRHLVVPHLDAHAAAEEICRLADLGVAIAGVREAVARVGRLSYDMDAYIERVDAMGRDAASARHPEDLDALVESGAVDPDMALPAGAELRDPPELGRMVILNWQLWNGMDKPPVSLPLRRPCAGFHPQRYAQAHAQDCILGQREPLAHWLRAGRPRGPWWREVFSPADPPPPPPQGGMPRVALHAHFHYPELAGDLVERLARNRVAADVFLSTDTQAKAQELRRAFRAYPAGTSVRVGPNRGRDVGPFLTGLAGEVADGGYDLFGHVHGKRSLAVDTALGDSWRGFLWENLIGGEHAMLDLAAAAFSANPRIGLLMAEDPHLVGWNDNRPIAEGLAARMGLEVPLDDFFDFPLGTMFWARPAALRPLLSLGLTWDDYPLEPLPYDGTILHALERLLPFAVRHAGFEVAGLRAPGTAW